MALFSRRKKSDSDDASVDRPDTTIEPGEQPVDPSGPSDAAPAADTTPEAPAEAAPTVGISMSSFRGVGAGPEPAPSLTNAPPVAARPSARQPGPMEAPEAPETVQGLRDNALLGNALAEISGQPEPAQLLNVARQLLQGHVFLRVKGDARALLAEGKDLPLAVANRGDEQLVLAYSGGLALRASVEADGDHDTSAMGQPVMALLRHVLSGPYAGIVLDPASGDNRAVLPKALLERMVAEVDPELRIKTALCETRTDETVSTVVDAIIAEARCGSPSTAPRRAAPSVSPSRVRPRGSASSKCSPTPSSSSPWAAATSRCRSRARSCRRRWRATPRSPAS